jgi:UDP-N-acetylmuramate dehydrogenase
MSETEAIKLHRREALQPYNTLALQADAEAFATVTNEAELLEALAWARAQKLPVLPLGEGSNIVLAGNVQALVVHLKSRGIQVLESASDTVNLRVAAGESWHGLVQWCVNRGYFGLENLALIPGTVGAAPIQNIGAYGVELQSVLKRVHARRIIDDRNLVLDERKCEFSYRDSVFKRGLKDQVVITSVDLQLSLSSQVNIAYPALASFFKEYPLIEPTSQTVFDAVVKIRSSKLPSTTELPNAGSFFKNPLVSRAVADNLVKKTPDIPLFPQPDGRVKVAAAWMIDHCGWKGFRRNDLGVHEKHALVLVNYGNNSGEQLLSLASEIAESVHNKFGVSLEIEPRLYGANW